MNHQETLIYLSSLHKMGIRFGLDPIRSLLQRLGNPQNEYPAILIAGTNGKGSVTAMIASILSAGGFRAGMYTSPDLVDFRERIRIDGAMISHDEAAILVEKVKHEITEDVSYFEFLTAMAFLHFREKRVDIAVLEIGMGGRLDATNVVTPLVSVITNISRDHGEYLGDTLEKIAAEKGGIIKERGICLTAARQKRVLETLAGICRERGAAFYRVGKDIRTTVHRDGTFSYHGVERRYERLVCPLMGKHQVSNAALALGALEMIGNAGFRMAEQTIAEGLRNARWEGRLEILQRAPALLVDGAHNPAGAATLRRALENGFKRRRLILVFGVLGDKDYRSMVKTLFPLADKVILTYPSSERALSLNVLLAVAAKFHSDIEIVEHAGDAVTYALSLAGPEDLVCVAGSLYLVGEIKKMYQPDGRLDEAAPDRTQ